MVHSRQLGLGHLPGGDLVGDNGLGSGFGGDDDPYSFKLYDKSGERKRFGADGCDVSAIGFTESGEIVDGISGSSAGGGRAGSVKHEFVYEKPVF